MLLCEGEEWPCRGGGDQVPSCLFFFQREIILLDIMLGACSDSLSPSENGGFFLSKNKLELIGMLLLLVICFSVNFYILLCKS